MAFNVEQHANLGFIDRDVKEMADEMRQAHGKLLKAELEDIIRAAYKAYRRKAQVINK